MFSENIHKTTLQSQNHNCVESVSLYFIRTVSNNCQINANSILSLFLLSPFKIYGFSYINVIIYQACLKEEFFIMEKLLILNHGRKF